MSPERIVEVVKNGSAVQDQGQKVEDSRGDEDLGEYSGLVRFISMSHDGRRESVSSEANDEEEDRRRWYAPWRKQTRRSKSGTKSGDFQCPEDWLNTEMRRGLTSVDVENRRKKTGWHELTAEKENLFVKFLMYFTGPIIYGQ